MTSDVFRYIFIGGAALAGVMFVVTVLLFFLLKIPAVIGDLTGATARKAIEQIRSQNEQGGENSRRSGKPNLTKTTVPDNSGALTTEKIAQSPATETVPLGASETVPLGAANETMVLGANAPAAQTEVLNASAAQTVVLNTPAAETVILNAPQDAFPAHSGDSFGSTEDLSPMRPAAPAPVASAPFTPVVIEYDITFVHSDEVIA